MTCFHLLKALWRKDQDREIETGRGAAKHERGLFLSFSLSIRKRLIVDRASQGVAKRRDAAKEQRSFIAVVRYAQALIDDVYYYDRTCSGGVSSVRRVAATSTEYTATHRRDALPRRPPSVSRLSLLVWHSIRVERRINIVDLGVIGERQSADQ